MKITFGLLIFIEGCSSTVTVTDGVQRLAAMRMVNHLDPDQYEQVRMISIAYV